MATDDITNACLDWTRIHSVLLDMDGTVLDLAFDNFLWEEEVPRRYAAAHGHSEADARAFLASEFGAAQHTLRWYDTRHWSRVTGLDLAAMHVEFRERITLLDGSLSFLKAVQASGRPIWLTTNAHPDSYLPKLAHTGIAPFFARIVSSAELGAPKEDQLFWQRLQERHDFDPAASLFVDDSVRVLQSALTFGIGQVVAMRCPDSRRPTRSMTGFASAGRLDELLPVI